MKKRWLGLTALALCLSLAPAAAQEERLPQTPPMPQPEFAMVEEPGLWDEEAVDLLAEPDYEGAARAIYQGIIARAEWVDLRPYNLPAPADPEKPTLDDPAWIAANQMYQQLRYRYAELFIVDNVSFAFSTSGHLVRCIPIYLPEIEAAMDFYDQALQAIVDQIPQGFSDAEKVLFIHDYLAANYEYDHDYTIYDAYGFLREGKGVCQAYTLTFSALMDRLGIPVSYVESTCLNHVWNVVELDGTWYHVDVTWDDPTINHADVLGGAAHDYFLISDTSNEALRRAYAEENRLEYANDQTCGLEGVTCSDDAYETGPWAQADSPAVYVSGDGSWYYLSTDLSDRGLYRWSGNAGEDPVRVGDYSEMYYGGIAPLVEYRGCLFFADPIHVGRYELFSGAQDTLWDFTSEPYRYSGFQLRDGRLAMKEGVSGELVPFEGELLPWHEVDDGLFSYYYDFDQMDIRLGASAEGKCFLVAWHNEATGQMLGVERIVADSSYPVAGQDRTGTLFILHSDGTWAPARPKFPLKPQLTTNR